MKIIWKTWKKIEKSWKGTVSKFKGAYCFCRKGLTTISILFGIDYCRFAVGSKKLKLNDYISFSHHW